MARMSWMVVASLCVALAGTVAYGFPVVFTVDSAPNVYGSPDWAPWWDDTRADIVSGGVDCLRTGTFPGTRYIIPVDETVYSFADLGKRLHWIYWVPGQDVTSLDGLLEVKWSVDWFGTAWTDSGGWILDDPASGWSQPQSWEDYAGGTIGSVGFAWWAAYPSNDPAALQGDLELYWQAQTYALGEVRFRESTSDPWSVVGIELTLVPRDVYALVEEHGVPLDQAFALASLPGRAAERVLDLIDEFGLPLEHVLALIAEHGRAAVLHAAAFARSPHELHALLLGYRFGGEAGGAGAATTLGIEPSYAEGDTMSLAFALLDPLDGEAIADALVTASLCSYDEEGTPTIHAFAVIPFDAESGRYALDIDLAGLPVGSYDALVCAGASACERVTFQIVPEG